MEMLVQQLINGLVLGSMYALIALGYTMVYGVLNLINFAHGDVLMIGALTGWSILQLLQHWVPEWPGLIKLAIAVLGAVPVCVIVSLLIERIAYRRLRHAPRLAPLITAIGVSILLQTFAMMLWGRDPLPFPQVLPAIFKPLQAFPSFVLVVFALGFFTSARISEQVRAGIQSLPRGQRYAGLAVGLTLPQTYRFVLLPMAFRIVIPPLTSESMNIIKNSSVAFAVSIAELTMFALQAGEETSRNVEMYLAVTGLYFVSAFAVNRVMLFVEGRVRVPGMIGSK